MKTELVLKIMKIVSWIIFIGLCIKAGALMISSFVSLYVNGEASKDLYLGLDLSSLYEASKGYYVIMLLFIISIELLKVYIFYFVLRLFSTLNLDEPFNTEMVNLITKIGYVSFIVGIMAAFGNGFSIWLAKYVAFVPHGFGSSEFLFMAGVVLVISFLYRRGVEIQKENKLTI